jgi:cardiolipin synthase
MKSGRAHPRLAPSIRRPLLDESALARVAGAPLVGGNRVRLLKDATENYPAWLDALAAARRTIHFESYIIHEDEAGRRFAEVLAAKARAGVRVRLLYDWLGGLNHASRRFWRSLARAGVDVRCFNPPRLDSPFGWLSRDHRKMLAIDGRVAFVTGLCIGRRWVGDPGRGIDPWRDTGVEIHGPAVAEVEHAFAETWAVAGGTMADDELPERAAIPEAGHTPVRVVASVPTSGQLYRLDQLIAASARRTLWLTDAYFVGVTPYVAALSAAARDGVDVRLMVPGSSDLWLVRSLSRASFRPLLEAGIRVFEWNGSMLHAKSAVADGRWARVGSTNLNVASWIGNWELDVAVEDEAFAGQMEAMYLDDLARTTEIVLGAGRRVRLAVPVPRSRPRGQRGRGSAGRAAAGALGIGSAVGAAITDHRALGPAEARVMASAGVLLLVVVAVAVLWPRLVAVPLALVGAWVALALLVRAWRLHREARPPRGEVGGAAAPGQAQGDARNRSSTGTR